MKNKTLSIIILGFFSLLFIVYVIVTSDKSSNLQDKRFQKQIELIGKIRFKGEIINKKIYRYADKNYHLISIRLDYSNTKDIYMFNDLCCIKIKNGTAVISAGVYEPALGEPKYVEVNMNNDDKIKTTYKDGSSTVNICTLDPYGASEQDMNTFIR